MWMMDRMMDHRGAAPGMNSSPMEISSSGQCRCHQRRQRRPRVTRTEDAPFKKSWVIGLTPRTWIRPCTSLPSERPVGTSANAVCIIRRTGPCTISSCSCASLTTPNGTYPAALTFRVCTIQMPLTPLRGMSTTLFPLDPFDESMSPTRTPFSPSKLL